MTYAQDFPSTWLGCGLIIGTSSGIPIKKGAIETIGTATPAGQGKEIRLEKLKAVDVGESTEGIKAGLEAKRERLEIPETVVDSGGKGSRATFGYKDPEEV